MQEAVAATRCRRSGTIKHLEIDSCQMCFTVAACIATYVVREEMMMNRACPQPLGSGRNCPPRQRSRFAAVLVGALALSTVAAPTHAQEVPAAIPADAPTDSSIAGVPAAPAPPRVVMQNQSGALSII